MGNKRWNLFFMFLRYTVVTLLVLRLLTIQAH